jgi:hypothetical protein
MSRVSDVIASKHKIENARRNKRNREMTNLRNMSEYKARLFDEMQKIEVMLSDPDIDAVVITIPDDQFSRFSASIYSPEMSAYDIRQDNIKANVFYIRHKFVSI